MASDRLTYWYTIGGMATVIPTADAAEVHLTPLGPTAIPDTSRFGIGEWYGHSFSDLSPTDRKAFAAYSMPGGAAMTSAERARLLVLREKLADPATPLSDKEAARKQELEQKLARELTQTKPCPFKSGDSLGRFPCTKKGGVCSLRRYDEGAQGTAAIPVVGLRGGLRVTCPSRFHEGRLAFIWASEIILRQPVPALVGEVGFLESSESVDGSEGEDVGRIDMVVVDNSKPPDYPLPWVALEIQAVYFSGPEMKKLFDQIVADVDNGGSGLVYPKQIRRPDYRSSGPKRLMPQLQIKVPTLRRWGKRMAIVADKPFFDSMGKMEAVADVSNADIAWFVVDFDHDPQRGRFLMKRGDVHFMTLEEAVKGLTGGTPVTMDEFETRIKAGI